MLLQDREVGQDPTPKGALPRSRRARWSCGMTHPRGIMRKLAPGSLARVFRGLDLGYALF
jgi:hypothetical protein